MFSEEIFDDPEPPELCILSLGDHTNTSADDEEFVELDPSGRYGRYPEVVGKGATKVVYKAYDKVDCKDVAWNKTKAKSSHAADAIEVALAIEREVSLLQRLKFKGIVKLYHAWVDEMSGDMNFITELCSSTLLDFCLKHKCISRKAIKNWARQILEGLIHLHTQDPPIIHRDLKCENIFMKSSTSTTLKIGDFGSATILHGANSMQTLVGTPEFMAPEMFEEDYNELVDVYSFGMCILELLTRECPYSECTRLAQVYKHIVGGKKPKSLLKVNDVEALQFINRCLLPACKRPSAKELLDDPFLQHNGMDDKCMEASDLRSLATTCSLENLISGSGNASEEDLTSQLDRERVKNSTPAKLEGKTADLVSQDVACMSKGAPLGRRYQVVGTKEDDNTLRLRIRIQASSHRSNILFPYNLKSDTPKSVAEEMIRSLGYPQSDLSIIASLISEELVVLASICKEGLVAPTCSERWDGTISAKSTTN